MAVFRTFDGTALKEWELVVHHRMERGLEAQPWRPQKSDEKIYGFEVRMLRQWAR
jgi:hypothetical protein